MEWGPDSDLEPEWTSPGPETGLEDPIQRLELGVEPKSYPERPNEADCIYYLRTGFCGYGSRCRFNHPHDRAMVMGPRISSIKEYPERAGQPVCQYYMRTGTCRFGSSCKYHHPKEGGGFVIHVPLNSYGYPLRLGEKECSYYMKTGRCKFGTTCRFHHPISSVVQVSTTSSTPQVPHVPTPVAKPILYSTVQSPSSLSSQQYGVVMARPPLMPGSYVQGPYGSFLLSPGMVSFPSWNPYLGLVNSSTQPSAGSRSVFGGTPLSPSAPAYSRSYQLVSSSVGSSSNNRKEQLFPEIPNQPECQYYLKTGDCKFGSSCKYHHPPEMVAPKSDVILSILGLPLRPGASPCTHYSQHGVCKFGPACKFDHPMEQLSFSSSTSSLSNIHVGCTIATLAPSSDLRPKLLSGSDKDSDPVVMSSSVSSSSESISLVFSEGAEIPPSSI
ncbi:hypothetical protein J1N35_013420 [Gossypium stocksii]|uniref:C3H1-type domain-containing protein n=1 Tax=Gossypium stocksii TaxID=47602 RepID=A0A9D4A8C8_9ROSI|nr:hypothetical protein J1N35_013420 [Gossypium stocksii]